MPSVCARIDFTLIIISRTYLLTPWSRVLLEKLIGSAAGQEIGIHKEVMGCIVYGTVIQEVKTSNVGRVYYTQLYFHS